MRSIIAFIALLGFAAARPQTFIGQNPLAGFGGQLFPTAETSVGSGALFPSLPSEVSIHHGDTAFSQGSNAIVQIHLNGNGDRPIHELVQVVHNGVVLAPATGAAGANLPSRPETQEEVVDNGINRPIPEEGLPIVGRPIPEQGNGIDRPLPEEEKPVVGRPTPETGPGIDRPVPEEEEAVVGRPTPEAVSGVQIHNINGISSVALPISGTVEVPINLLKVAALLAREQ